MKSCKRLGRLCSVVLVSGALSSSSTTLFGETPATQPAAAVATKPSEDQEPSLKLSADGFPAGHESPEGAACDLARAFIKEDNRLFREICVPPFGGGDSREAYEDFLRQTDARIKAENAKGTPAPEGPKVIAKLFAARQLSHDGPASYGYAAFNFNNVMFVDVGVLDKAGNKSLCRTLVIQKADGKWFVDPYPQAHPLLCDGLNDESISKQDFSEVYHLQK